MILSKGRGATARFWIFLFTLFLPSSLYANTPDWEASGIIEVNHSHQTSDNLTLSQPLHLRVAADQTVLFQGDLTANFGPATGLVKRGPGMLTLAAENPNFRSGIELIEGTLALEHEAPFGDDQYLISLHGNTRLSYGNGTHLFRGINTSGLLNNAAIRLHVEDGVAHQLGRIHGDVDIHKTGAGTLLLSARAESPNNQWQVQAGGLQVDNFGLVNGTVVVHSGSWLGGNGSLGAVHIKPGAWLRPSGALTSGIGWLDPVTLQINRGLTLDAGSHLALRTWADGRNDAITIHQGDAWLEGELHVYPQGHANDWQQAQDYRIIDTALGLNGSEFSHVASVVPYLSPSLRYTDNEVWLRLQPQVANPQPSTPQQPVARPSSWQASLNTQLFEDSRFVREAALAAPYNLAGGWARSFYTRGKTQAQASLSAHRRHAEGLFVGYTLKPHSHWQLAGLAGYHHSRHKQSHADKARTRIHHYHLGFSAAWENDLTAFQLGLSHSWHKASTQRNATVKHLAHIVDASGRATTRQGFAQIELKLPYAQPFLQTAWIQQRRAALKESGGPLAMAYERHKQHILLHSVGWRAQKNWEQGSNLLSLSSQLAWHSVRGKRHSPGWQTYRHDPLQTRLTAKGHPLARHYWQWELAVHRHWHKSMQLQLAYQLLGARKTRDHGATASLSIAW